jgi:hypothetical protein
MHNFIPHWCSFWTERENFLHVPGEKGDGQNNYWYKDNLVQKMSDQLSLGFARGA